MPSMTLVETIGAIQPIDRDAARTAARRLDMLTKPRGSLGYLEELVTRYAAIRRDPQARCGPAAILVFVADHGVAAQGVSAYPAEVTVQMLRNFASGGAAICALARHFGHRLTVIDAGVAADTSSDPLPGVIYHRIGAGTRDFMREPAMDREAAVRALEMGIGVARQAAETGATLIGIGEMGIANSSAAAALISALTGIDVERIAGRGTGLDESGWRHKLGVLRAALALHRATFDDGLALLAALGGFEIAAMAGACLGAAANHVPCMVDGFIATAAAAIARKLAPALDDYLLFAHRSAEGGHQLALDYLGARPILDLDLRLGEGTGAALALAVIQASLAAFHGMATFAGAGVAEKL